MQLLTIYITYNQLVLYIHVYNQLVGPGHDNSNRSEYKKWTGVKGLFGNIPYGYEISL